MNRNPILKINHFRLAPIIGLGYWKEVYGKETGFEGTCHNFVLPFLRIQKGYLQRLDDSAKVAQNKTLI